jgi:hypothetical protein
MHRIRTLIAACGLLTVAACGQMRDVLGPGRDDALGPVPTTPLRTDSSVYHVRTASHGYELTIGVSYTNPTRGNVYIPTCHTPHPPVLQKLENGSWVTAYVPVVLMCLGPPVIIGSGRTYEFTYRIWAGFHGTNNYPQFEVREIPGTYRLVWQMLRTWTPNGPNPGLGEPLPVELSTSDPFELRMAPRP